MIGGKLNSRANSLFRTQKRAILEIWDQMQRVQTDFALAQELTFYYTSPQWHAARTVLDLGTGNGYYLGKIAARFPEKIYHGVDVSPELITIAETEAGGGTLSFSHRNLLEVTEPHDLVLMRLLLQHLDDIQVVLDHVAAITKPGGAVFIIDSHDPLRFFYPDLPEFVEFFTFYVEHERQAGRDRRVASRLDRAIVSSVVWKPGGTLQLLIPSTIPGNLDLFSKTYTLLVDLVEQAGDITYNFASVKKAWKRWSELPNAYMQVGLNLISLERV
jgi:ubiquinone/menaquinone biosynthesis C-methylase UbiE